MDLLRQLIEMAKKRSAERTGLEDIRARKVTSGYGLLGTKYKKKPKYRDKPRQKKVKTEE